MTQRQREQARIFRLLENASSTADLVRFPHADNRDSVNLERIANALGAIAYLLLRQNSELDREWSDHVAW